MRVTYFNEKRWFVGIITQMEMVSNGDDSGNMVHRDNNTDDRVRNEKNNEEEEDTSLVKFT